MAMPINTSAPEDQLCRAYREAALLLGGGAALVDLVISVGRTMGLDAGRLRRLELGVLLHDVGKAGIPHEILNKPGGLEPEERALIEQHPVLGEQLLHKAGGVLAEVGPVVRSSHERYDGMGYPDGLAGQAIPVESRIIACCDAFTAMTTTRPYREALSAEDALLRLRRNSGTQFDPEVVDALLVATTSEPRRRAAG